MCQFTLVVFLFQSIVKIDIRNTSRDCSLPTILEKLISLLAFHSYISKLKSLGQYSYFVSKVIIAISLIRFIVNVDNKNIFKGVIYLECPKIKSIFFSIIDSIKILIQVIIDFSRAYWYIVVAAVSALFGAALNVLRIYDDTLDEDQQRLIPEEMRYYYLFLTSSVRDIDLYFSNYFWFLIDIFLS